MMFILSVKGPAMTGGAGSFTTATSCLTSVGRAASLALTTGAVGSSFDWATGAGVCVVGFAASWVLLASVIMTGGVASVLSAASVLLSASGATGTGVAGAETLISS